MFAGTCELTSILSLPLIASLTPFTGSVRIDTLVIPVWCALWPRFNPQLMAYIPAGQIAVSSRTIDVCVRCEFRGGHGLSACTSQIFVINSINNSFLLWPFVALLMFVVYCCVAFAPWRLICSKDFTTASWPPTFQNCVLFNNNDHHKISNIINTMMIHIDLWPKRQRRERNEWKHKPTNEEIKTGNKKVINVRLGRKLTSLRR